VKNYYGIPKSKEWGSLLALGAVLQEAVGRKEMLPPRDFMDM
jgi:hypothetical protein